MIALHREHPTLVLNLDGVILIANSAFAAVVKRDLASLEGEDLTSVLDPASSSRVMPLLNELAAFPPTTARIPLALQHADQTTEAFASATVIRGETDTLLLLELEELADDVKRITSQSSQAPSLEALLTLAEETAAARSERSLVTAIEAAIHQLIRPSSIVVGLMDGAHDKLEIVLLNDAYHAASERLTIDWAQPQSTDSASVHVRQLPDNSPVVTSLINQLDHPLATTVVYDIPLAVDQRTLGHALLLFDDGRVLSDADSAALNDLAMVSAAAIDVQHSRQALEEMIDREQRLRWIIERINAALSLDDLLDATSQGVFDLLPGEFTAITTDHPQGVTIERSIVEDPDLRTRLPANGGSFPTPDSVTRQIAATDEQIYLPDFSDSTTPTLSTMAAAGLRALLATPIPGPSGIWGVLDVARNEPASFSDQDRELLSIVADVLGTRLRNVTLFEASISNARDLEDLQRISKLVVSDPDVDRIVSEVVALVPRLFNAHGSSVRLLEGDELVLAATGGKLPVERGERLNVSQTEAGRLLEDPHPLFYRDLQSHPHTADNARREGLRTHGWATAPLLDEHGKLFGILSLRTLEPRDWTGRDEALLTALATVLSQAYRNARAAESSRQVWRASIESLIAAIDARDHDTFNHSRHVALLARQIARECDIPVLEIEQIELAALLHDIGKIGIPDQILRKPAELSSAENEKVRDHPTIGAQILAGNASLAPILPLVRHHHERWDGTGYPDGLAGGEIPIGAAVLAVADALDTMATNRPYRQGMSHDDALATLQLAAGSQFHPVVVQRVLEGVEAGRIDLNVLNDGDDAASSPPVLRPDLDTSFDTRPVLVLHRVASEIRNLVDLPSFTHNVTAILQDAFGHGDVLLYLREESDGDLVLHSHNSSVATRIALGDGMIGAVAEVGEARFISMGENGTDEAALAVPIVVGQDVIGVLAVTTKSRRQFVDADRKLLQSTADLLASTLQTARLHDEFHRLSHTDPLTGLGNHRAFYAHLDAEITRAKATESKLTVLLLDINQLKAINDTLGHLAGDEALRQIARVLKPDARPTDLVYRYGGDEFAMILPASDLADARQVIDALNHNLHTGSFTYDRDAHRLPGGSWGLAIYPADGTWSSELVNVADMRMYQNKRNRGPASMDEETTW